MILQKRSEVEEEREEGPGKEKVEEKETLWASYVRVKVISV